MVERDWSKPLELQLITWRDRLPRPGDPGESEEPEVPLMYQHFGNVTSMEEHQRLKKILYRVKYFMRDGRWRTLEEISKACGCSESTAGARMRDFRKIHFGGHTVPNPIPSDIPHVNLYRLILNPEDADAQRWAKEEEALMWRYLKAKEAAGRKAVKVEFFPAQPSEFLPGLKP